MATIVEFPQSRDDNRYARRFHEGHEAGAKILLFTGIRYERSAVVENAEPMQEQASVQPATTSRRKKRKAPKSAS